jgi:hypothetical protein
MKARVLALSTLLLAGVGGACPARAPDQSSVSEAPDLTLDRRDAIASQSCRAWHGREIARLESDWWDGDAPTWWWGTCLPHGAYDTATMAARALSFPQEESLDVPHVSIKTGPLSPAAPHSRYLGVSRQNLKRAPSA